MSTSLADRRLPSLRIELAQPVAAVGEGEDRTIAGTAAAYNVVIDRGYGLQMELLPGCFKQALKDPARVKLLWQHDRDEPIGALTGLDDDRERLRFAGRFSASPNVPLAAKARDLYLDGIMTEVSVGFEVMKFTRVEDAEQDTVLYQVSQARLMEVSCVTWGALGDKAKVSSVNSGDGGAVDVRTLEARRLLAEAIRLLA